MTNSNYSKNHHNPKGFGKTPKPEQIKIPDSPEWLNFRETLKGATAILIVPPMTAEVAKLAAAVTQYLFWLDCRLGDPVKIPPLIDMRIAQQICADYLGCPRAQFERVVMAFSFQALTGGGNDDN